MLSLKSGTLPEKTLDDSGYMSLLTVENAPRVSHSMDEVLRNADYLNRVKPTL